MSKEFTLKAVKTMTTTDFDALSANIYHGTKKVGTLWDDGMGGESSVTFDEGMETKFKKAFKLKSSEDVTEKLFDMAYSVLENAVYRKDCKTKTLFLTKGGQLFTINHRYSKDVELHINKQFPNEVKEIINKRFM